MKKEKIRNYLSVLILAGVLILFVYSLIRGKPAGDDIGSIHVDIMDKDKKAQQYSVAKDIVNPAGFINTESITIKEHIGKNVILVDFWTYTCINCLRTTPYLNSWYEKYKDKGLVIVGVHTPEFSFEKEYDNVLNAVNDFEIKYPVVLDNDYATWRAYENQYWPRKYLIDIDGFIVYNHIGEGAYEETEMKIQELLEERSRVLGEDEIIRKVIAKPVNAEDVDFRRKRSPEIYFGSDRNIYLGNGKRETVGEQTFAQPGSVALDTLYLVGDWDITPEYAESKSKNAKIIFRYKAQKVFIVASSKSPVKAEILVDGKTAGERAGSDVKNSKVEIGQDRLYRLIEDVSHGEHTLEIIIEEPGLKAFTFTFG
ncbi:redoxin family protein [Patescibacteria group bacterium]|nr:redoxin family protein [Patescibacteria group bacterium]